MPSSPSIDAAEAPAVAPVRKSSLEEDDIKLGSEDDTELLSGRQTLRRPSGVS